MKGNQWYFGMKAHISVDSDLDLVHTVVGMQMNVQPSMCTVGDAYDNAMAEGYFATLECELIDRRV